MAVLLFLYAPIVIVVIFAFNESTVAHSFTGFTTKWFIALLEDPRVLVAWGHTIGVSVGVVIFASIIGTLSAYVLVKYPFRGRWLVVILIFVPIIIPRSILGIALLLTLEHFGVPRSLVTVGMGQLIYVLPFVIIAVLAVIATFDTRLEEAAMDLGASPTFTFRKITLPLIKYGIAAGMAVSFILSFGEFTISFYLSGVRQTLPLYIFSEFQHLITPKINALSTLAVIIVIVVTIILDYVRKRATVGH